MSERLIVGCYPLVEGAKTPFQATEMSACYDLCACLHTETIKVHGRNMGIPIENFGIDKAFFRLFPDEMALVPTGLVFIIPPTHHIKFYSRSGNTWKKMLKVANQPAVIDADYTLESFVLLHNQSNDSLVIRDGDAIAQIELVENTKVKFQTIQDKNIFENCVEEVKRFSSRDGGLGSTDGVGGVINTKA